MSNLSQLTLPVKNTSTGEINDQTFNLPIGDTWVGTCESAASEQHKVVTVDNGFVLKKGVSIAVKFSNSNTFSATSSEHITLNVNGTGAKEIYYSTSNANTGTNTAVYGNKNRYLYYTYDGTYWVWNSAGYLQSYGVITKAQIKAGTETGSKVVRADYLNQAITEMIEEGITGKANSSDLAEVATSGSFNDLTDVPTFPTVPTELVVNVAANATSASFTNAAITSTATYDVYTSVFTSIKGMSISGTTLTVTLKPVSSAMQVKLRIS